VAFNILVNLVVIPRWGAVGAALASSASYALSAIAFVLWVARVADRPFTDGVIISFADSRWVLNLLLPKFFRGRKEGKVD
jgi:O-antigen/teichoic acid export membrane protein